MGSGRGTSWFSRLDVLQGSCRRRAEEDFTATVEGGTQAPPFRPRSARPGGAACLEGACPGGWAHARQEVRPGVLRQHSGRAWMSARARHFEFWAREASWFMCTECHRLEPRPFHQSSHDKNTQLRARQKKCKHCARGIGYKAPSISDIPEPLRDLTATALWALRPIEIDVGEYRRGDYGYRITRT